MSPLRLAVFDMDGTLMDSQDSIVRAMEGPSRVQPDDPGGQTASHQGLAVNAVQSDGTQSEQSKAAFLAFLSYVAEHRHLYRIVRQAEFVDEALYRDYYRKLADGYIRRLEPELEAGRMANIDAETLAFSMMGIFDFLGMRWALWEGRMPPQKALDDVFAFVDRALAP